jgi:L-alanine-DL-glutamate epimerase-like enolase superfamily enzyme
LAILSHLIVMAATEITKICAYKVNLPLKEGSYSWSGGKSVQIFDATIVEVSTNVGVTGYGECCPLGSSYLPSFAEGCRAGIEHLAPSLIGENPLELAKLGELMDKCLKGHPYVKSPIDVACWDILGKVTNQPIVTLLGGRFGTDYGLYRAISQGTPTDMKASVEEYRREGYKTFQLKVGSSVDEDIARIKACSSVLSPGELLIADANTGWLMHEAVRVCNAVKDCSNVYIEQPCKTYEENTSVRNLCQLPFIIDENMDDVGVLHRIITEKSADAVNLKISKVGGLTKARQIRDLCVSAGLAMNVEDTWGSDIATAAISHLAHSTPPPYLLMSTDFNSYVTQDTAFNAPKRVQGRMKAPEGPGLGVQPMMEVLGEPLFTIS